jgi:uncharacterized phosphosugar-binding protein
LPKAASLSTLAGSVIVETIVAEVAAKMHADGIEPPLWTSANVPVETNG